MDVRVNITIPKDFLKQVDREAKREHRSRSELIREALRHYMATPEESREKDNRRSRSLAAARRQDRIANKVEKVDSVKLIRKMRDER